MARSNGTEHSLRELVAEREAQWQRFARWESKQRRESPLGEAGGELHGAAVRRAIEWYGDAFAFAQNVGAIGPAMPETHLEDLVEWVRRWRRAWRAT